MIQKIQINNYKSIRSLDLDMKPINILIGSNGSGKSNFIGFFKFLKNIYDRNLQNHIAEEGSSEDILHFGSKVSSSLSGKIDFKEEEIEFYASYEFELRPNADYQLFFQDEYATIQQEKDGFPYKEKVGLSGRTESILCQWESFVGMGVIANMQSFRVFHFHDTSKTSALRKPAQLHDNDFFREDGANLPAFLYWLQQKHPKDFKKIELVIRSVDPFFDCFSLKAERLNEEQIRLRWKEKGSEAYFDAKHLSDGTLRFIALATLLLQPEPPQVVLIDEPELGLHPFAINKLSALIQKASARTQLIISTQSANLVDNFDPEDIITVDRKDNQSAFKRQSLSELQDWLDEYSISDLWNKNVIGGRP